MSCPKCGCMHYVRTVPRWGARTCADCGVVYDAEPCLKCGRTPGGSDGLCWWCGGMA